MKYPPPRNTHNFAWKVCWSTFLTYTGPGAATAKLPIPAGGRIPGPKGDGAPNSPPNEVVTAATTDAADASIESSGKVFRY